jgi:hypothetical protein
LLSYKVWLKVLRKDNPKTDFTKLAFQNYLSSINYSFSPNTLELMMKSNCFLFLWKWSRTVMNKWSI